MSNRIPAGNSTPQIENVQGLANLVAAFLITPSGANLLAALTTSTGTGLPVFSISPTFTGTPIAPTAALNTNTTQIATTAFVLANGAGDGSVLDILMMMGA